MSCPSAQKIIAALHDQAEEINKVTYEEVGSSDRYVLGKIPDQGTARQHANNSSIIYGQARQASTAYRELNYGVRGNPIGALVDGEMTARSNSGNNNGIFSVDINDVSDNACHGQTVIDFAQGFRRRDAIDFEASFTTPTKCFKELSGLGESHIRGYFRGFKDQFVRYGLDNFNDNLMNLVIRYGEANSSVLAANSFELTTGGWQAPPLFRITIHFLQDYKRRMKQVKKGFGKMVKEDWLLEVELPELDWIDAVLEDQKQRNLPGTSYNTEMFKDDQAMGGRKYGIYGGIKCYFNDTPIRGYFKQNGTSSGNPTYNFIRVYDWINQPDEVGGLSARANYQYDEEKIIVDGVRYDMVTLCPQIDPESFMRWGLAKPLKTIGEANDSVNYDVKVLDGAYIESNDHNDKARLVARHEFRFKAEYPEFSGFIAYRHSLRTGYTLAVQNRDYVGGPNRFSSPEVLRPQDIDASSQAECGACGQVAESDLQCVSTELVSASILGLAPAGAVTSAIVNNLGYTLRLAVERTGEFAGAASVNWTSAHVTTNDTDFLDGIGTLVWEAGDAAPKYVEIAILPTAVAAVDQTFTVTLSAPVGGTLRTGATVTTVTLTDLTD